MDGVARLLDHLLTQEPMVPAVRRFPARLPRYGDFPEDLDARIVEALRRRGIERLYAHQARAFDLVREGRSLVVVTPTASGKSLCYHLPVLQALVRDPAARALYLFPTKALAQDQLAELDGLAQDLPELRIHTYDGDTPQEPLPVLWLFSPVHLRLRDDRQPGRAGHASHRGAGGRDRGERGAVRGEG